MVLVSRLNGGQFYINPDKIEFMEETPDTVLTLESGRKIVVQESAQDIIAQVIAFRREILKDIPVNPEFIRD